MSLGGRIRLPTCVVKMRSVLCVVLCAMAWPPSLFRGCYVAKRDRAKSKEAANDWRDGDRRNGGGMSLRDGALPGETVERLEDRAPLHVFLLSDARRRGGVGRGGRHFVSGG